MDLERLRVKVHPAQTALLVIDMQKDYCCEGGTFDRIGFDVLPAQQLAPRLNQFLEKARSALKFIVHLKMTKIPGLLSDSNAGTLCEAGHRETIRSRLWGILRGHPAGGRHRDTEVQVLRLCFNVPGPVSQGEPR